MGAQTAFGPFPLQDFGNRNSESGLSSTLTLSPPPALPRSSCSSPQLDSFTHQAACVASGSKRRYARNEQHALSVLFCRRLRRPSGSEYTHSVHVPNTLSNPPISSGGSGGSIISTSPSLQRLYSLLKIYADEVTKDNVSPLDPTQR